MSPFQFYLLCWLLFLANSNNTYGRFTNTSLVEFSTSEAQYNDITHTLDGLALRKIKDCPAQQHSPLCPHHIHIVIIASSHFYSGGQNETERKVSRRGQKESNQTRRGANRGGGSYDFNKETIEHYANHRGYHLRFVDPLAVLKQYGSIRPDHHTKRLSVIASKSLIMKCESLRCDVLHCVKLFRVA
jgi:hypothetical protein